MPRQKQVQLTSFCNLQPWQVNALKSQLQADSKHLVRACVAGHIWHSFVLSRVLLQVHVLECPVIQMRLQWRLLEVAVLSTTGTTSLLARCA